MAGWTIGVGLATAAGALVLLVLAAFGAAPVEAAFALRDYAMCIPVIEVPPSAAYGAQGTACAAPRP